MLRKLLLLLFSPILFAYSQEVDFRDFSESFAREYLINKGYNKIERDEDTETSIIILKGINYDLDKMISFKFHPKIGTLASIDESLVYSKKPNLKNWKNSLYQGYKIKKESKKEILAEWDLSFEKKIKHIYKYDSNSWIYTTSTFYPSEFNKLDNLSFFYFKYFDFLNLIDSLDLRNVVDVFIADFNKFLFDILLAHKDKFKENRYKFSHHLLTKGLINPKKTQIEVAFNELKGETIAVALGMNNDEKINLVVDPKKWNNYSKAERFYILYHELGHDIFNFNHGNGGRMMFNYKNKSITFKTFNEDKESLFETMLVQLHKSYSEEYYDKFKGYWFDELIVKSVVEIEKAAEENILMEKKFWENRDN